MKEDTSRNHSPHSTTSRCLWRTRRTPRYVCISKHFTDVSSWERKKRSVVTLNQSSSTIQRGCSSWWNYTRPCSRALTIQEWLTTRECLVLLSQHYSAPVALWVWRSCVMSKNKNNTYSLYLYYWSPYFAERAFGRCASQRVHDWGKSCSGSQDTRVEKERSNLANAQSSFLTILKDGHLASAWEFPVMWKWF